MQRGATDNPPTTMKRGSASNSTALEKEENRKAPDETEFDGMIKSLVYCENIVHNLMAMKICFGSRMRQSRMPNWSLPKRLNEFRTADRISEKNGFTVEYEKSQEVLEMVLANNHSVANPFSKKYATIVECPDQVELFPLAPLPAKGLTEQIQDSVQDLVRTVTLQPPLEEPPLNRWVPVESRIVEIHLCEDGPMRSHRISKQVSVLSRFATVEEIRPYEVEFHISQKAWHERMVLWLRKRAESSSLHYFSQCGAQSDQNGATSPLNSIDSMNSHYVPKEIEVLETQKPKPRHVFKAAPSMDSIWIPEYDVVLNIENTVASTVATRILKNRVVPYFGIKEELRPSQVHVMALMLQEELKDEEKFANEDLPMANFWMKIADCEEKTKTKEQLETKWLRKDSGDFMGPFVHASDKAIQEAAVGWVKEFALKQLEKLSDESLDPAPSSSPVPAANSRPSLPAPALTPPRSPQGTTGSQALTQVGNRFGSQPNSPVSFNPLFVEEIALFNMTGPIETLDQKAKEVCQGWVNDSETLLIKAAKKTLIDSFQTDFHSFLFLFQLQLKRIKAGYENGNAQSDAPSVISQADDRSWVSAEPSVKEEDDRVSNIEAACIAFMNQMGNDMVKHYDHLSSEKKTKKTVSEEKRDESEAVSERNVDEFMRNQTTKCSSLIHHSSVHSGSVQTNKSAAVLGCFEDKLADPGLVSKDVANLTEVSIDLSTASTVQRFTKQIGAPQSKNPEAHLPPKAPPNKRRADEDFTYSDDEGSSTRSDYEDSFDDTYGSQSFEPSLEDDDEEECDISRDCCRHKACRGHGWRRRCPHPYDYDSPISGSGSEEDDDTCPTVDAEALESVTVSPSELSLDENEYPTDSPVTAGWSGLSFWS